MHIGSQGHWGVETLIYGVLPISDTVLFCGTLQVMSPHKHKHVMLVWSFLFFSTWIVFLLLIMLTLNFEPLKDSLFYMWSLLQVYLTHLEETPCVFLYISMSCGKFLIVWTSICKILSLPRLHLPLPALTCSITSTMLYYIQMENSRF